MLLAYPGVLATPVAGAAAELVGVEPQAPAVAPIESKVRREFDIAYLPAGAVFVTTLRPAELAAANALHPVMKFADDFLSALGLPPEEIELFTLAFFGKIPAGTLPKDPDIWQMTILRMRSTHDWTQPHPQIFGGKQTEQTLGGQKYFRLEGQSGRCYFLPDDRTIVLAAEHQLARLLAADPNDRPSWSRQWTDAARSPVAFAIKPGDIAQEITEGESFESQFMRHAELVVGNLDAAADGLTVRVVAECHSLDATAQVASAIEKVFAYLGQPNDSTGPEAAAVFAQLIGNVKVTAQINEVCVEGKLAGDLLARLFAEQDVEMARREDSHKQSHVGAMRRLVVALHEYHAAHGHFPSSAVLGPDGKTPHSWRVELLPYLGLQELYGRYNLAEPWDSKQNSQLLEDVPAPYRGDSESPEGFFKGASQYFLLTGKGTLFDGNPRPGIDTLRDPPGETILLIENSSRIPWTQPQDYVAQDDRVAIPAGHFKNGFLAAFVDGSVCFLPDKMDPLLLRALVTRAGGEQIVIPEEWRRR